MDKTCLNSKIVSEIVHEVLQKKCITTVWYQRCSKRKWSIGLSREPSSRSLEGMEERMSDGRPARIRSMALRQASRCEFCRNNARTFFRVQVLRKCSQPRNEDSPESIVTLRDRAHWYVFSTFSHIAEWTITSHLAMSRQRYISSEKILRLNVSGIVKQQMYVLVNVVWDRMINEILAGNIPAYYYHLLNRRKH